MSNGGPILHYCSALKKKVYFIYTHTHTHTHTYIYIYRERERERETHSLTLRTIIRPTVTYGTASWSVTNKKWKYLL